VYSRARLPTRTGAFEIISFTDSDGERMEDVAIVVGDVADAEDVETRVHSECLTGDVFGSVRCDCRDQLELALERISHAGRGVLLYMRQEGRGIGIAEKVKAYALQDGGLDTVEANLHLGYDEDLRDYGRAAAMLRALDVSSVILHTNNPEKIEGLRSHGITVSRREPIIASSREENAVYLATKREKMRHEI
jgi:GTP cyclohydrolase II